MPNSLHLACASRVSQMYTPTTPCCPVTVAYERRSIGSPSDRLSRQVEFGQVPNYDGRTCRTSPSGRPPSPRDGMPRRAAGIPIRSTRPRNAIGTVGSGRGTPGRAPGAAPRGSRPAGPGYAAYPGAARGRPAASAGRVIRPTRRCRPGRSATTADGVRLAGWWWRVLAAVIDSLLVSGVVSILAFPVWRTMSIKLQAYFEAVLARSRSGGAPPALDIGDADVPARAVDHHRASPSASECSTTWAS